jgi:TatD DNase family protein
LDKHWDDCDWDTQVDNLNRHWTLSFETGLPVILHSLDCELEMLEELERAADRFGRPLRGIMHSFVGQVSTAERCLKLGLHISFAGMVTFKKSDDLRAVAAVIPQDKLLIETDSPYLTPEPNRGRRPNTPAQVIHTAECLAKSRGVSLSEIAKITTANACKLFSVD